MNIELIKEKLLMKYPTFGGILANTKFIKSNKVSTAGTDGKNIYYNESFIENLDSSKQLFVFAHEVCHIAFDHINRSKNKNPHFWNLATDSVINAFLIKDGLVPIEGFVDNPDAYNCDSESYYQKLLKEQEEKNKIKDNKKKNDKNGTNSINQNTSSSDEQLDKENNNINNNSEIENHDLWNSNEDKKHEDKNKNTSNEVENSNSTEEINSGKSILEKIKEIIGKIKSKLINKKPNESEKQAENKKDQDEIDNKNEDIKRFAEMGEKQVFKENREALKKELEKFRDELKDYQNAVGKETDSLTREIDEIENSTKLVDWRRILKESIKEDADWTYKNATIEYGVITPHLDDIPKSETEILLDTSGSVDKNLLKNFMRECLNVLKSSKIKVGCFDTEFYGFNEIRSYKDIEDFHFVGGGGTDFEVAVNSFTKRVENKIVFTDGMDEDPKKYMNAIWIVFGEYKINPPGGKVIYLDKDQLEKLNAIECLGTNKAYIKRR